MQALLKNKKTYTLFIFPFVLSPDFEGKQSWGKPPTLLALPFLLGDLGNSEERGGELVSFLRGSREKGTKEEASGRKQMSPSKGGPENQGERVFQNTF